MAKTEKPQPPKTLSELAKEPFSIEELIVLDYLLMDYTNEKIAEKCDFPLKEVNRHCRSICAKTGFSTKRDLLRKGPALIGKI